MDQIKTSIRSEAITLERFWSSNGYLELQSSLEKNNLQIDSLA